MATKKFKAPEGMNPIDAADFAKYGSFVHGDPYVGASCVAHDAKGNPVNPYTEKAKGKTKAKRRTKAKSKK